MGTRRGTVLTNTEKALWIKALVADLGREGRTRSITKRIERASDIADLAVRAYRQRITWRQS